MADVKRVGDLEIAEDLPYQQRLWAFQRVSWVVMALIAMGSLLGLFGEGRLSDRTKGDQQNLLWLEYEQFGRYHSTTQLNIHLTPIVSTQQSAQIWISRRYLKGMQVQAIVPEPHQVVANADYLTYYFKVTNSQQPLTVTIDLQTNHIGHIAGEVGRPNQQPLQFHQFIYP
jgi:hypothetical protein